MKRFFATGAAALLSGLLLLSCQNNEAGASAEQKDTITNAMDPKKDNTGLQPDTMQVQVPADSALQQK